MRRLFSAVLFLLIFIVSPADARVLDIGTYVTPKGITVWMVEDRSLPVISLAFAFKTGSAYADPSLQGVTQLLSNTLDEGAGPYDSKVFQGRLRDHAIDLSFAASRDYFSGGMRTIARHGPEAFALLKLAVNQPRFDPEAVVRMREANLSALRDNMGDADWIAMRLLYDAVFKGHPYAFNSGGTVASLGAIDSKTLKAEWGRIFNRDNLVVGISGDIASGDAMALVDDIFGDLPRAPLPPVLPLAVMHENAQPIYYAKDMPQTIVTLAWEGIAPQDPDYYAAVVLDYIFGGGGFSSRLMEEIREKRGLTYGISSNFIEFRAGSRLVVNASVQPQNTKATIDLVMAQADLMRAQDVSAPEIESAKEYLIGSLPLGFSSTRRIADALVSLQALGKPATYFDDYKERIGAVSASDIRRVAGRIFAKKPTIVLVGALPEGVPHDAIKSLPNTEKPDVKRGAP